MIVGAASTAALPDLVLYPRQPHQGRNGGPGRDQPWRLDRFLCLPLLPGQPPNTDEQLAWFHGRTVDRQERAVPIDTLRRYDVETGFGFALVQASTCRA